MPVNPVARFVNATPKVVRVVLSILLGVLIFVSAAGILFVISDRTNGSILSSGSSRRYLLHVPAGYDPSKPVPLVISIHGFAGWPANQSRISGWNDLADREGFIVVYPSGTGFPRRWSTSPDEPGGPLQDVIFISDLIDSLEGHYTIDPARIYVNGLSNGAGMSFLLGCELSERIAAIGGVSGAYLYPLEECTPSRSVPMIAFHGTADKIVPYHGGPSRSFDLPFPDIPAWMKSRAALNSCDLTPVPIPASGDVTGVRYTGCAADADVVFYTITGGGHAWPGGDAMPRWIVGHTSRDISATETIWEFFQQYTLPIP